MNKIIYIKGFKLTLILVLTLSVCSVFSQVNLSHKSGWFYIEENENVFVNGNITSLDSNEDPIINLGEFYITDSISCFGTNKIFGAAPDTIKGNVYLVGVKPQYFAGDKNIRFGNVFIQNIYDSLFLENNVDVYNKLKLDFGNIYINDFKTLDLLKTGRLIGETNSKRIFSNNYGQIHFNPPLINGNTYNDISGCGIDLTINGNLGINSNLYRKNVQQVNVSNGSIDRFYFFNPDNNGFVSNPAIRYLDTIELHNNIEDSLRLFLSTSFGNTWTEEGGTTDINADITNSSSGYSMLLNSQAMLTLAEGDCDNPPYLKFEEDTIPLCDYSPAYLYADGVIGMASVWSNGSVNADSIQVTTPGTYKLTITDTRGCRFTDSVVVINAPNPVADFSVPPICIGSTSQFNNLTTIYSGSSTYKWDLNDPYTPNLDTTSEINPSITYQNQGSFVVNMEATSNYGCKSSKTKTAYVNPYPNVSFSIADNCEDSIISIVNSTTVLPNATISYQWSFGNGTSSTAKNPVVNYNNYGPYYIKLEASSKSCTSVDSTIILIHPNPHASFTANSACLNQNTVFNNTSSIDLGTNTYNWNFDNGNTSGLNNPSYLYNTAGTYNVRLKATSDKGCTNDTTIQVNVNALPNPSFTAAATCMGDSMQLLNNSNSTSQYEWSFANNVFSNDYESKFVFNTSGTKTVTIKETDINGCISTINQSVISKPKPIADFVLSQGCEQENISFLNASSTPSGSMSYLWDFDDNQTSNLNSPNHIFTTHSVYNVKLKAENNGCFDSIIKPIQIYPKPVLDFGGQISTCADSLILDAQNNGSVYQWSDLSTQQTLTVKNDGLYWVNITTNQGCNHTETVNVQLSSVVSPSLGIDSVYCDFASINAGYPGSNYLWSNGDTTQSVEIYNTDTVWVEVTDQNGCVGRDTIIAGVVPTLIPDLGADLQFCDGESGILTFSQSGKSYLWNTASVNDSILINNQGLYWIEMIDSNNCISRDSIQITYNPNPVLNLGLDANYCDSVYFDISQSNTSYLWDNGSTIAERKVFSNGVYWAEVTDITTGCNSLDTINLSVSASPIVNLGNDTILCSGEMLSIDAGYSSFSKLWNTGDTSQYILASSTGEYVVNVTSTEACVGVDTINIIVSNPLNNYLGSDFVLCNNTVAQISSPINNAIYQWMLNDSILVDTTQSIIVGETGELVSIITNQLGCSAYDTINLLETGSEANASFLVATQDIYTDDTVQFVNLTYPSPFSNYWTFSDGTFSIAPNPTHRFYNAGTYRVLLEVDNGICTDTISKLINVQPAIPRHQFANSEDLFVSYSLYPNPNDGIFNLEMKLLEESVVVVSFLDMYGKLVRRESVKSKDFLINYNFPELAAGMYFINMSAEKQTVVLKFIKK